jgi:hypothetical protein
MWMPKTIAQLQTDLQANVDRVVAVIAEQYGFASPADASPHMRQIFGAEAQEAYRAYLGTDDAGAALTQPTEALRRLLEERAAIEAEMLHRAAGVGVGVVRRPSVATRPRSGHFRPRNGHSTNDHQNGRSSQRRCDVQLGVEDAAHSKLAAVAFCSCALAISVLPYPPTEPSVWHRQIMLDGTPRSREQ